MILSVFFAYNHPYNPFKLGVRFGQPSNMPVLKPLSGDGEAPQQRKQPSRKGKKAWRKNVDVSEVQEGLDELNTQIIAGYVTLSPLETFSRSQEPPHWHTE